MSQKKGMNEFKWTTLHGPSSISSPCMAQMVPWKRPVPNCSRWGGGCGGRAVTPNNSGHLPPPRHQNCLTPNWHPCSKQLAALQKHRVRSGSGPSGTRFPPLLGLAGTDLVVLPLRGGHLHVQHIGGLLLGGLLSRKPNWRWQEDDHRRSKENRKLTCLTARNPRISHTAPFSTCPRTTDANRQPPETAPPARLDDQAPPVEMAVLQGSKGRLRLRARGKVDEGEASAVPPHSEAAGLFKAAWVIHPPAADGEVRGAGTFWRIRVGKTVRSLPAPSKRSPKWR